MKKLGEIGIGDIPVVTREEKFKVKLPLEEELFENVKNTPYMGDSEAKTVVRNLFTKGGKVFLSEAADDEYGSSQVATAYDYMKILNQSESADKELKMAVISWIANNIFDLEKMKEELEPKED